MKSLIKESPLFLIVILSLILSICSCKQTGPYPEKVEVQLDSKLNGRMQINIKRIIPLETNDSCLIGGISKLSYFNNRFYVLDADTRKSLMVFNDTGKFIRKTEIGKGPGEVIGASAFTINPMDSLVIVYSMMSNYYYDLDLNYKNLVYRHDDPVSDLAYIDANKLLVFHYAQRENSNKSEYVNYSIASEDFSVIKHLDVCIGTDKGGVLGLMNPISIYKDTILFIQPCYSYIYQMVDDEVVRRYWLDFGKYGLTNDEIEKLTYPEMQNLMFEGKKVFGLFSVFDTEGMIGVNIVFRGKYRSIFYSKSSKAVYMLDDAVEKFLIPDCIVWGVDADGLYYAEVEPDQMDRFQKKTGKFQEVKGESADNPSIITFTIEFEKE